MKLRYYQSDAVKAAADYLRKHKDTNPCIVIPTGGGKSPVIGELCRKTVEDWNGRVLVIAHRKELIQQNVDKIRRFCDCPIGIYSAGLRSKKAHHPITVAGIQSVYRHADDLFRYGVVNLVLCDECHLLPEDGDGMYLSFIDDMKRHNPKLRIVGLTATPYRMSSGEICKPNNLLNEICYEIGIKELIANQYLCPVTTKCNKQLNPDTSGLHLRSGEFIESEIDEIYTDELVKQSVAEIVSLSEKRNKVLIFTPSVRVAEAVKGLIEGSEMVTGQTPAVCRETLIESFKTGSLKYLVNVNVLTTGFDAPNIDTIALMRPTASPGLFYQMCGRGFRIHPDKTECLILDYGRNIWRHGAIDAIEPVKKRGNGNREANGEGVVKECPNCGTVCNANVEVCPDCGTIFPKQIEKTADNENEILSDECPREYIVDRMSFRKHFKRDGDPDAPPTLAVTYHCGIGTTITAWYCPEHPTGSFAHRKANEWWQKHCTLPIPNSVDRALQVIGLKMFSDTKKITARKPKKYYEDVREIEIETPVGAPTDVFDKTKSEYYAEGEAFYERYCDECLSFKSGYCTDGTIAAKVKAVADAETVAEIIDTFGVNLTALSMAAELYCKPNDDPFYPCVFRQTSFTCEQCLHYSEEFGLCAAKNFDAVLANDDACELFEELTF